MDFGEILEQWENRQGGDAAGSQREAGGEPRSESRRLGSRYQLLKNREPQGELDLHGLSVPEATVALERFLREAAAGGLGKVLIIHGKGNHTRGRPVLEATVRAWLENSPLAGAFGRAERRHGGGGATWVILREREPG